MGSLENLPLELFLMIFDQLRQRDFKALRLVSRTFSTFLSPHLLITTLFFQKKFSNKRRKESLQKALENPRIRRSVKELAFDMKSLHGDVKPYHWEVVGQIKKISAFVATYKGLVIEKMGVIMGSYDDMTLCFNQVQRDGITSIRKIWIRPSGSWSDSCLISTSPSLQMCAIFNSSKNPTERLGDPSDLRSYAHSSLRRLHLICYSLDSYRFDHLLERYNMPNLEEVVLIDITWYSKKSEVIDQTQKWVGFAKGFDSSSQPRSQPWISRRLLIGDTKGSVCCGSHVDYSRFKRSVRKLSEDEVIDMMSLVDFEG